MKKFLCSLAVVILGVSFQSSNAYAQGAEEVGLFAFGLGIQIMMSSTGLTTYGFSTYGVVALVQNISRRNRAQAIQLYLQENQVSVAQELALGGGEASADLATLLSIPPERLGEFSQILRSERRELSSMVSRGDITVDDAEYLVDLVVSRMGYDVEESRLLD